jgi:hypothetical protein
MASSDGTEIRDDGEWLAELAALQCEIPPVTSVVRSQQFDSPCNAEKAR